MSDASMNSDIRGIYDSCKEFGATMENDNYWCWNTEEGDYSQIWILLGFVLVIYSAQFIMIYTAFINRFMAMSAIKIPIQSTESIIPFPKVIYYDKSNDFVSFLIHILVHWIYFAVKIFILHSNYLSTVNEQYESMEFEQFVNVRNSLLALLILLAPTWFILNNVFFKRTDTQPHRVMDVLKPFAYILLFVDVIYTFIILCIHYSLLILILYWIALELLIYCIVICIFICLTVLFMSFIVECWVNQCINVIEDDLGDIMIELPATCTQFIFFTVLIIVLIGFWFGILGLLFFFMWYFLGGPPHAVFYADFNKTADSVIYWLLLVAVILAISTIIGVLIRLCYNDESNEQGVHRQIGDECERVE